MCCTQGAGLITCGSETSGGIRSVLAYDLIANGTFNCINFKSAITRGGTVEKFMIIILNEYVGTMLRATMDWNPAYSYSTLPKGYSYDSIPNHWKVFPGKGRARKEGLLILKTYTLRRWRVQWEVQLFPISGMKESLLKLFSHRYWSWRQDLRGYFNLPKGGSSKGVCQTKDNSGPESFRTVQRWNWKLQ